MNHAVPSPDSNNWGNWMSKVGLLFKEKKKKNKLGEMITSMKGKNIYIDNKIYFYFGIDGEIASLEYIINLFDSNEKLAIKLLYLWIKNSNDTLFLSHCDKIKHLLDLINKKSPQVFIRFNIILFIDINFNFLRVRNSTH